MIGACSLAHADLTPPQIVPDAVFSLFLDTIWPHVAFSSQDSFKLAANIPGHYGCRQTSVFLRNDERFIK